MRTLTIPLLSLAMTACFVEDPEDLGDDLATDEQAIINGDPAVGWMRVRAVHLDVGCTGTMISPTHVLTAAHCLQFDSTPTAFVYPVTIIPDLGTPRTPVASSVRPGVTPLIGDLIDTNGDFADVAVLRLGSAFPQATVATLAWTYPSSPTAAFKVGRGNHDGGANPLNLLFFADASTFEADDTDGDFLTVPDQTNPGDSGGPFYVASSHRILGTLFGDSGFLNRHTSVPFHLDWILGQIGYTWPSAPALAGWRRTGSVSSSFSAATHRICQYACDRTGAACVAYNYNTTSDTCALLSTPGSLVSDAAFNSDLK